MLWELVAVIVAGVGAAGFGLVLRMATRKRLPSWIVPAFAGFGMIATSVNLEYSWFPTARGSLPEGAVVVGTADVEAVYKPWTYIWPYTEGFLAVGSVEQTTTPTERTAVLYRVMRWQTEQAVKVLADCANLRIARQLSDGSYEEFANVGAEDPALAQICR